MLDNSLAQLEYENQHNSLAQLEDSRLESEQKQVLTTEMYLNDSIPFDDMINDSRHLDSRIDSRIEEEPAKVQDSYGAGTPMNESPMEHGSINDDAGSIKLSEDGWGQEEQFNKTTELKEVIVHQAEGENDGFEMDFGAE